MDSGGTSPSFFIPSCRSSVLRRACARSSRHRCRDAALQLAARSTDHSTMTPCRRSICEMNLIDSSGVSAIVWIQDCRSCQ
jgi:hypothetical protein